MTFGLDDQSDEIKGVQTADVFHIVLQAMRRR